MEQAELRTKEAHRRTNQANTRTDEADILTEQVDSALRESEVKLRKVFECSRDAIGIAKKGIHVFANPAYLKMFGLEDIGQIVGTSLLNQIAPSHREQMAHYIEHRAAGTYAPTFYETRGISTDGHEFDVEIQVSTYELHGETFTIATLRDITVRKQAEVALLESEAFLKESQRLARLGSYVTDFATGRWRSSEVLDEVFGIGPAYDRSVAGWVALVHPDDRARMVDYLEQEVIRQRQPFDKEYRIIRQHDQAERWVKGLGRMEFDAQGRPLKMIGTIQDITERKQADMALRQSEERYHALFNRSLDGVFLTDFAGNILDANQALLDLLGFQRADIVTVTFASLLTADQLPLAFQSVEEIKATGHQQHPTEFRVRGKDGRQVYLETQSSLIHHEGKPFAILGIARDVTARIRAEAEIKLFRTLVDQANDSFLIIDPETGRVLDVNEQGYQARGYCREEFLKLRVFDIDPLAGPEVFSKVVAELRVKGVLVWLGLHRRKDGSTFPVEVNLKYVKLDRDYIVADVRDITERQQAEASLRESEAKYRNLFECSRDALLRLDLVSRRFTAANPSAVRMFGAKNETEITGHGPEEFSPERQPDGQLSAEKAREIDEIVRRKGTHFFEWTHRRISGEEFQADVLLSRIEMEGKAIVLATVRDISERRQALEKLQASEENYRKLFATMLDGFAVHEIICDAAGRAVDYRFLAVNPAFERLTGLRAAEVVGRTVMELMPDTEPKWIERYGRVALTGEPAEFEEYSSVLKKHFEIAAFRSRPGQFATVFIDITKSKTAEAANARLAMAVEQAAETIVITDASGTILYVNPSFEQTTGYTRAEVLGQNPRVLKSGKQDNAFYHQMWDVLNRGEVWHGHFINKRKDGTLYEEEATISPIRDATGNIINFVAVKRDVTHEVELEAQFRQVQKMEAIGTLAGGVAHDFNNILAIISMQASLLKSGGGLSAAQMNFADEIGDTVDRAAALTRQLLMFSRRETLQLSDLDWSEAVTTTTKMLRRILGETIKVQLNLAAEPMFIHADPGMMDQVLLNLAVNARDAMPAGGRLVIETAGVEFDAFAVAQSPQARLGAFVCLSVSDSGGGIPPEVLPRIFEPFFTTKEVGKGTGLGLATVFGIIQQHQGWINVYSEPGQGTTFKVYLPRQVGMSDKIIAQKMLATDPIGNETILLVEDETVLRESVSLTLSRLGYRVLEAATGVKALKVWQNKRDEISLLLTDLVMPDGMNGNELAQHLLAQNPQLKVIYMSGYSSEVAGQDFLVEEGVNFLTKPFQAHHLAQIIRDNLDKPA